MTYADIPQRKWVECSRQNPCPACGKTNWCSISSDGRVAICRRGVESKYPFTQADGTTVYLHPAHGTATAKQEAPKPKLTKSELRVMAKRHKADLTGKRLSAISRTLGVSEKSLTRIGIGFDVVTASYSFPMYNGDREPLGFRLRSLDGSNKRCVKGSRNGLFVPEDYDVQPVPVLPGRSGEDESPLLLLMPEGPTDLAAALDLGFRAIGRPNNSGGANHIIRLLSASPVKQDVVMIADNDETKYLPDGTPRWPGIEGAVSIAEQIKPACARLRVMLPPNGAKDLRAWAAEGSHLALMRCLAEKGRDVTTDWLLRVRYWLNARKAKERVPPVGSNPREPAERTALNRAG